jgi:hypothetical protein
MDKFLEYYNNMATFIQIVLNEKLTIVKYNII